MQTVWSNILAGEANSPGAFSKRTVNALSSIDQSEAKQLVSICRFGFERRGLSQKDIAVVFLTIEPHPIYTEKFGNVVLTPVGRELATICEPTRVEGFLEFAIDKWVASGEDVRVLSINPNVKPDAAVQDAG